VGRRDWCQALRAALIYAECRYSEKRADRFFAHTARGHLARADSLAECVGALWARFASEREASEWIANHVWWAEYKLKPPEDDVAS
jgi:hypothetical protein